MKRNMIIVKKKEFFNGGFTLIELLLVISLVLIVSIPVTAFSTRFIYQMSVRDSSEVLIGMLQNAQILSMLGKENSSWGVKKEAENLVLFSGESFLDRNQNLDQIFAVNSKVYFNGFDEVVFSRYGGFPSQQFSQIKIYRGSVEESFALNSEGVIE